MRLYSASSLFGALRQWLGGPEPEIYPTADPIDHPDIASMSLRELADLPLRVERCECSRERRSPCAQIGEPMRR